MDTEQVQASQAEVGEPAGKAQWPDNLYHKDAYSWIAYSPRSSGSGVSPATVFVLNKRNAEAPEFLGIPLKQGNVVYKRQLGVVASSQGRAIQPGDYCLVQSTPTAALQVLAANSEATEAAQSGPGQYRCNDAFRFIWYKGEKEIEKVFVVVWNSRDGVVPDKISPYLDKKVFVRTDDIGACDPTNTPEAGSLVFVDADTKGTPKIAVATAAWLDQFKKKFGNPQNTIKRLEGLIEAAKKSAEWVAAERKKELEEKDTALRTQREGLARMFEELEMSRKEIQSCKEQIARQAETIAKDSVALAHMRRYEQLSKDFAAAIESTDKVIGEPQRIHIERVHKTERAVEFVTASQIPDPEPFAV